MSHDQASHKKTLNNAFFRIYRTRIRPVLMILVFLTLLIGMNPTSVSAAQVQTGPTIDVWYGDTQDFGLLGNPQEFYINILGNVSDVDGVSSLSYTLDGGGPIALSIGKNNNRLANIGDFNIDIDWTTLSDGPHTVEISATDGLGNISTKTV